MKKGDYVIATKYRDGDPMDHFVLGFFDGMSDHQKPRYNIVDGEGRPFRGNGFRRAQKITQSTGEKILENITSIEHGSITVWEWVKKFEKAAL